MKRIFFFLIFLAALPAWAEPEIEGDDDSDVSEMAVSSFKAPAVEGYLDLRPSYDPTLGVFHTENEVAADFRMVKNLAIGYVQEFRTNLSASSEKFSLRNGFLRTQWDPESEDAIYWGLEPRLYLPTYKPERDVGFRGAFRPIFKVGWEVSPQFTLELWESPIVPYYTQPGYEDDDGFQANRLFENRVELIPELKFYQERVVFRMPIVLQSLRNYDFEDAPLWNYYFWINPEVLVMVQPKTAVGLSYYSDTIVGAGTSLGAGLKAGIVQAVLQQSF